MKQFKAEWQINNEVLPNGLITGTLENLITQHNALCDYLEERLGEKPSFSEAYKNKTQEQMLDVARRATLLQNATYTSDDGWHITLPKPEWWDDGASSEAIGAYVLALSDASKALGVEIRLTDTH